VSLDIEAYDHFCGLVRRVKAHGSTVLISTHQLSTIEDLCSTVGMLENATLMIIDTRQREHDYQPWLLATDHLPVIETILKKEGAANLKYCDGYWRFDSRLAATVIPGIVAQLAAAGAPIREIRQESHGLKKAIKAHHEKA
jgi:ABC-type multidrug transport system ATPase subunit